MAIDIKALAAKATAHGVDMTVATTGGGGDYTPPAAGPTRLRFVGYIEIGKQKGSFKGVPNAKDKAMLIFELSGKNHPPVVNDDGTKTPIRITVTLDKSLNEKSHFFKVFTRMNYKGAARHIAELLGEAYKGEVFHDKWTGTDGKERIDAILRGKDGYTIQPPRVEDDEVEGGWRTLEVAPALSEIRCFLWDYADAEQWAGIFIPGEYPERKNDKGEVTAKAKSKNVLQNKIKQAVNFQGSPMHELLVGAGVAIDIPDAEDGHEERGEGNDEGSASPSNQASKTSTTTSPSEQVAKLAAGGADALSGIC